MLWIIIQFQCSRLHVFEWIDDSQDFLKFSNEYNLQKSVFLLVLELNNNEMQYRDADSEGWGG